MIVNPLSAVWVIYCHENTSVSKSESTSASNCKVIRDGEAGRLIVYWSGKRLLNGSCAYHELRVRPVVSMMFDFFFF